MNQAPVSLFLKSVLQSLNYVTLNWKQSLPISQYCAFGFFPSILTPLQQVISPADKIKYDEIFVKTDKDMDGFVSGVEARELFLKTGLPSALLAHIWQVFLPVTAVQMIASFSLLAMLTFLKSEVFVYNSMAFVYSVVTYSLLLWDRNGWKTGLCLNTDFYKYCTSALPVQLRHHKIIHHRYLIAAPTHILGKGIFYKIISMQDLCPIPFYNLSSLTAVHSFRVTFITAMPSLHSLLF